MKKTKRFNCQQFFNQSVSVFTCVLVAVLGVSILTYATTTIGTNISTDGNLIVSGNATTTGSHYFGNDLSVLGNASTTGSFTLSGIANFLSDLTVSGNATTTGSFVVSGESTMATTTLSGDLDLGLKELKNAVLEKLADFPSSPTQGQMFYSTASTTPYWYTGSQWKGDISGATFVVAASDSVSKEKADYVCDGTADDVQIQAAIDALPSGGGKVQLMEGTFTIDSEILITKDSVSLEGCGQNTIIKLVGSGSTCHIIRIKADYFEANNLTLNGNRSIQSGFSFGFFFGETVTYGGIIHNCWIVDTHNSGVSVYNAVDTRIVNNYTSNNGCHSIYFFDTKNSVIANNIIYDSDTAAIGLVYGTHQCIVNGNTFRDSPSILIDIVESYDNIIVGNNGNSTTAEGVKFKAYYTPANNNTQNNLVIGNRFSCATGRVIYVEDDSSISDNIITENILVGNLEINSSTIFNNNKISGTVTLSGTGANSVSVQNIGYTTETSSTATISSGNTYIAVTHGLSAQPATSTISITQANDLGNASTTGFWISDVGATTFRINVGTDPGASGAEFVWQVGSY